MCRQTAAQPPSAGTPRNRPDFRARPVAEIQHSTKQCGASVRGHWSTSAKSNPAAVAKIVDLTRRRDRLIPLGGRQITFPLQWLERFQNFAYCAKDVVKLALDPVYIGLRRWRLIGHGAALLGFIGVADGTR